MTRPALPLMLVLVAGCTAGPAHEPSLAPRPAEAIDPRVPVASEPDGAPADVALTAQLNAALARAQSADAEFAAAENRARGLASAAGPAESESWVAAQLALSELERLRADSAGAAADVDSLASERMRAGRMAAADLAALDAAAAKLRAINERQVTVIDELTAALKR